MPSSGTRWELSTLRYQEKPEWITGRVDSSAKRRRLVQEKVNFDSKSRADLARKPRKAADLYLGEGKPRGK